MQYNESDYTYHKKLFIDNKIDEKKIYDDIINFEHKSKNETKIARVKKIFNNEKNIDKIINFIKNFINLKFEIYKYFEIFLGDDSSKIYTDFNYGNFGYIKGTHEIRCFDPIAIDVDKL